MEHGSDSFEQLFQRAKNHEVVKEQKKMFEQRVEQPQPSSENVCQIESRNTRDTPRRDSTRFSKNMNIICNRCGFKGHHASDEKCPARERVTNAD